MTFAEQVAGFAVGVGADVSLDLRTLRIVPDGGIFELPADDFEPLTLGIEVKDTSAVAPCGPSIRPASMRSG